MAPSMNEMSAVIKLTRNSKISKILAQNRLKESIWYEWNYILVNTGLKSVLEAV